MRQRKAHKEDDETEPTVTLSHENVEDTSFNLKPVCKWFLISIILIYILTPVLLFFTPQISEQMVFLNLQVGKHEVQSLSQPASEYGLHGTGTFHIDCDDVRLGVWHVMPTNKIHLYKDNDLPSEAIIKSALHGAEEVIIYLHGSSMSRATGEGMHRADFYKVLQKEGFHTIAFDYRGFGDSTGWPSEMGLVKDFQCLAQWIRERVTNGTKIIAWGHSLGAAILTRSMRMIGSNCEMDPSNCLKVDGIILEGGFTNVIQGAKDSYPAYLFSCVYPSFLLEMILKHSFNVRQISMVTDENIAKVKEPILLLHAEDDDIIPFYHGVKLFNIVTRSEHHSKHTFIQLKSHHKYSHNFVYKCDKLYPMIRDFIHGSMDSNNEVILI